MGADSGCVLRIDIDKIFHHQVFIRVSKYLAVGTDQEGITDAAQIERTDNFRQGIQSQVTTDHTERLVSMVNRSSDGHHQLASGCIQVRLSQSRTTSCHRILVPRPGTRVIIGGQFVFWSHRKAAVDTPKIGEVKR
ncbi:hypothetical protein D3C71_1332940 [compost metagenome]